jgi:hypothetical protein
MVGLSPEAGTMKITTFALEGFMLFKYYLTNSLLISASNSY